jgi:glycine/D-amino acid oxidase-like deaminating enzyme
VLDRPALAKLLPGLGPAVAGGTYCPHDGHARPLFLLRALHAGLQGRGGRYFPNHPVASIAPEGSGFRVTAGEHRFAADKLVLAAGLGNKALAEMVGLGAPVRPLHGQLLVTERTRPVFEVPTNIVRQTSEGSFLLGYSEEDRGFDTGTSTELMRDIAWRCATAFPFLADLRVVRTWSGLRVMTPDGLPIYEQSTRRPGAFVATCHSGVTLAANHARLVAGWIADGGIPQDYACFGAARFDVQAT